MHGDGSRSVCSYGPGCALIVVDVQNDFVEPGGSLPVPGGREVASAARREVRAAREAGAPVFYTQDWHPEHTPHFARDGGRWPVHCVEGTWGAELVTSLPVQGPVIRKGTAGEDGYSGFFVRDPLRPEAIEPTRLEGLLRSSGVHRLVVVGLATEYCVAQTARDALRLGFDVAVLREATRPIDERPGDGQRALADLEAAGAHVV
jgi:nicotinamidase/pyrazinamidase